MFSISVLLPLIFSLEQNPPLKETEREEVLLPLIFSLEQNKDDN